MTDYSDEWTEDSWPWWWQQQDEFSPGAEVFYEVLPDFRKDIVNYYVGFSAEKPTRNIKFKKIPLWDFLWQADQAGFCVGEGWGMPLDDS